MKLACGFCIPEPLPVHTCIKGRQVHPLIRFLLPFRPCPLGRGRFLSVDDGDDRCLQCLALQHAEDVFEDDLCTPDPELTDILARAAVRIGLEVNRPPSPEPSRLDDCFLGAGRGSQPHSAPVSFSRRCMRS